MVLGSTLKEEKEGDVGIVSEDYDLEGDALAYGTTSTMVLGLQRRKTDRKDINAQIVQRMK